MEFLQEVEQKYLWYIFTSLLVFAGVLVVNFLIRKVLSKYFDNAAKILQIDATNYSFIKHTVTFIIYLSGFILLFFLIPEMHSLGVTLFAGAGIFTAILAMASSQAFTNIVSGLFIVIFKPFRVKDRIKVGLSTGFVEDITLRHTVIRDFENQRVIIPNSVVSTQTIINSSIVEEKSNNIFEIRLPYFVNFSKAKVIIEEVIRAHELLLDNRTEEDKQKDLPVFTVKVTDFLDSLIVVKISVWTNSAADGYTLKTDVREKLLERFQQEKIYLGLPTQQFIMDRT